MNIALEPHSEGVVLPVRVQPGGRANAVRGRQAGLLKVSVTQIAEKGKANQAVIDVLASALGLRKSRIVLLKGRTAREKSFLIRGVTAEQLTQRLASFLTPSQDL